MLNFLTNVISEQVLVPLLNAATLAAIAYAGAWFRKKRQQAKQQYLQDALASVEALTSTTVKAMNQTVVDELKKNGDWNKDNAKKIFAKVKDVVVAQSPQARKIIEKANMDFLAYVTHAIESKVQDEKKRTSPPAIIQRRGEW